MKNTGYTLVESLVAVSILTIAVAGPLVSASRAAAAAYAARDELAAAYLAEEAIEYVRAMRDDVYLYDLYQDAADLSTTAWNDFLTSSSITGALGACRTSTCLLDPLLAMSTPALYPCAGAACNAPLYINSNNIYTQNSSGGATATTFVRNIVFTDIPGDANEEKMSVTVSWTTHGMPYSFTISDTLTAWQ